MDRLRYGGRSRWFAAMLLCLALIVAACGSSDDSDAASDDDGGTQPAEGEPVAGGTLVQLHQFNNTTLDPVGLRFSAGSDAAVPVQVFDTLVQVDDENNPVPRLAESVENDAEFRTWTVQLRDDLQFSDGTPLDAEAVVFNWDRHLDESAGSLCRGTVSSFDSYEAVDDVTIEVTLTEPNSQFAGVLAACAGLIGSPAAIEELGEGFATSPVGAGPFMVEEFVQDDHITLVRNPNYWDAPRPYLDELTFQIVTDPQQRADTFQSGTGETAFFNIVGPQVSSLTDAGFDVLTVIGMGGTGLQINPSEPPLDDDRVRQALVAAIDLETVNDQASDGFGQMVTSFFPEDSPLHDSSTPTQPTGDPAHAQELIDDYIAENGGPVAFTASCSQTIMQWCVASQQAWNALDGVEATVDEITPAANGEAISTGNFQLVPNAVLGTDPEPAVYGQFHSGGQRNFVGYNDPEIDAALEAGRVTADVEERREAYAEAIELIWEKAWYVFWYHTDLSLVVDEDVRDVRMWGEGFPDYSAAWLQD